MPPTVSQIAAMRSVDKSYRKTDQICVAVPATA